jgi:hypothetical protein
LRRAGETSRLGFRQAADCLGLATIFTAFADVVIYLALWYLMPEEPPPAPAFDPPPLQPWKKSV